MLVTFINITDPFNMEPTPEPETRTAVTPVVVPRIEERVAETYFTYDGAPGLEALSTAATSNYDWKRPLSLPAPSPNTHVSPSNTLNFILNPAGPDASEYVHFQHVEYG